MGFFRRLNKQIETLEVCIANLRMDLSDLAKQMREGLKGVNTRIAEESEWTATALCAIEDFVGMDQPQEPDPEESEGELPKELMRLRVVYDYRVIEFDSVAEWYLQDGFINVELSDGTLTLVTLDKVCTIRQAPQWYSFDQEWPSAS